MSYKVLYQAGQDEIEEKKSRFIAHTLPVTSEEEAVAFLNKIKRNIGMHVTTVMPIPSGKQ
ncbi:MAG: hypothetical protein ACLUD0_20425 [Eubacterium ramulus]